MSLLVENYLVAKKEYEKALEAKTNAENAILNTYKPEKIEGTNNFENGGYQIKIITGLNRSLNMDAYDELLDFVDFKPQINLKKLRFAENMYPDRVAKCVTTKPAKPKIEISIKQ